MSEDILDIEQLREFAKQYKDVIEAVKLTNSLVEDFKRLKSISSVYTTNFLSEIGVEKPLVTTEDDLNSSLVANRLGLAFNKHLKTFETLRDATSPEAFVNLKNQYLELAELYSDLLKVKTPKPVIEYVTEYTDGKEVIENLKAKIEVLKKDNEYFKDKIEALENELEKMHVKELRKSNQRKLKSSD